MFFINIHQINILYILLTYTGIVSFGKISFARNGDNGDLPKCYNNLLLNLPNQSFSASSIWTNRGDFEAHQARMSTMIDMSSNHHGQAWCSNNEATLEPKEWIQIDLGDLKLINLFITVGRGEGNFKEFMSFYYLEYEREENHWIRYKNENGKELMTGNADARNVARTHFESLFVARKIRLYPLSKQTPTRACLRIAIYGCNFDDGVIEYSIPQGHYFITNENEKYDFRDLTYDGESIGSSFRLVGGIGQLMDNVIYQGTIHNGMDQAIRGFHFVGWNKKMMKSNELEIILKLDQIRRLKEIKFYTLNMIPNDIGVFKRATLNFSIGGEIYDIVSPPRIYETNVDRRVYHSRWIDIPLHGILTKFIKVNLLFEMEWIVLSEIILISERTNEIIPKEKYSQEFITTKSIRRQNNSTVDLKTVKPPIITTKKSKTEVFDKRKDTFSEHSIIGFVVTLACSVLGFLLLLGLIIFGIISIKRRHRRIKGKLRYPTRMNGGPFIGDSLVVPLTGGTHSSSGTGSIYYKHPANVDLGLSYPIMGKEYMTLSSKSGTDYDMAGGNSLDGLLPASKDTKYNGINSHFSPNTFNDNPYPIPSYSRHSNDGSMASSYTEYATTSVYHFPQVMENVSNIANYNQSGLNNNNNNFPLQFLNQNVSSKNGSPYKVQSPTPSSQMFGPNHIADMFPQYSPYRHMSFLNNSSPMHNAPSRFLTPANFDIFPVPYLMPASNFNPLPSALRGNILPPLQGIFGNSLMISIENSYPQPISTVSLTNILSNLKEINQDEIEHISIIGRGENGSIGYIKTVQNEIIDGNIIPQPKTYLSKSLSNYVSKDIRSEIVRELGILVSIKHSAFIQLTAYAFDHQNSMSIKQLTLCFLFEIDEHMENLYTLLQQQSIANSGIINLPRGPILYSQSISNLNRASNVDTYNMYPSVPSLLYICSQIAKGMGYLEIRKIIHRDLAARNCLVSENLTVKITDIAMSIQKFKEHYIECTTMQLAMDDNNQSSSSLTVVKQNYPLQWMAFETILQGSYTTKSDVWSFGVTMWEIITRCQKPPFGEFGITIEKLIENAHYLSLGAHEAILPSGILTRQNLRNVSQHNNQTMIDYLNPIFDPEIGLSRDFSDLIRECWHKNALQRPSFENISIFLEQKVSHLQMDSLTINS